MSFSVIELVTAALSPITNSENIDLQKEKSSPKLSRKIFEKASFPPPQQISAMLLIRLF